MSLRKEVAGVPVSEYLVLCLFSQTYMGADLRVTLRKFCGKGAEYRWALPVAEIDFVWLLCPPVRCILYACTC